MAFKKAKYLITTHDIYILPQDDIAEVVFVGKSNVGKSSIINALTNQKKLAFVSSSPGKTKAMSLFEIEDTKKFRLVDVPGYGFAKVAKWNKGIFVQMLSEYFGIRKNCVLAVILLDMRREVSEEDYEMIDLFNHFKIPFMIVGTKLDKCNQSEKQKFQNHMKSEFHMTPLMTSAETKENINTLQKSILDSIE